MTTLSSTLPKQTGDRFMFKFLFILSTFISLHTHGLESLTVNGLDTDTVNIPVPSTAKAFNLSATVVVENCVSAVSFEAKETNSKNENIAVFDLLKGLERIDFSCLASKDDKTKEITTKLMNSIDLDETVKAIQLTSKSDQIKELKVEFINE